MTLNQFTKFIATNAIFIICNVVVALCADNNEAWHADVSVSRRRSVGDLSEVLTVTVRSLQNTDLNLIPSQNVYAPSFKFYKITGRGISELKHEPRSEPKMYIDIFRRSSLAVLEDGNHISLEGILDENYRIAPDHSRKRSAVEGNPHIIYNRTEIITTNETVCKYERIDEESHYLSEIKNESSPDEWKSRRRTGFILPEVLIVLDYLTTKHFKSDLNEIKKYYGAYYNSVNGLYSSIHDPKIVLNIVGIVLTEDLEEERKFAQQFKTGLIEDGKTLGGFAKWIHENTNRITIPFDIAFWTTGLDMGVKTKDDFNSVTLGIAYLGTACKISKNQKTNFNVAIGEDNPGKFTGINTHAHEIAHVLGSTHDGEKGFTTGQPSAENCNSSSGYVMSGGIGTKKKFHFSPCSKEQMKWFIGTNTASCLWNSPDPTAIITNIHLPGQTLTLDEQCKGLFRTETYKYMEIQDTNVCEILYCTEDDYLGRSKGAALEGTPCGTGKHCLLGNCIKSAVQVDQSIAVTKPPGPNSNQQPIDNNGPVVNPGNSDQENGRKPMKPTYYAKKPTFFFSNASKCNTNFSLLAFLTFILVIRSFSF